MPIIYYIIPSVILGLILSLVIKKNTHFLFIADAIILVFFATIYFTDIEIMDHSLGFNATQGLLCPLAIIIGVYFAGGVCLGYAVKFIAKIAKK